MAGVLVTAASRRWFGTHQGPGGGVFVEAKEMCVCFFGDGGKVKHREKGSVGKVGKQVK